MAERVYVFGGNDLTVSTKTLILGMPSSLNGFEILQWAISQSSSGTSGMQRLQEIHVSTLGSPVLTAATVTKTTSDDPSSVFTGATGGAAGTWGVNAATDVTAMGIDIEHAFHIFSGREYIYTPPVTIKIKAGNTQGWGLVLPAAPGVTTGWNIHVWAKEL